MSRKKVMVSAILGIILLFGLFGCSEDEAAYIIVTGDTSEDGSNALATIEFEHHMVHEGYMFTVLEVFDMGNGEVHDTLIVTPDTTRWAHMVWEIEHELETTIQFYRDTTYSDNGTPLLSFNRDGNSTNDATTLVYHIPTITNVGTLMATIQQGDGKKAGGSDRESNEFILKQNCAYLIRITNLTANDNLIFMKLNWYELTNNVE